MTASVSVSPTGFLGGAAGLSSAAKAAEKLRVTAMAKTEKSVVLLRINTNLPDMMDFSKKKGLSFRQSDRYYV